MKKRILHITPDFNYSCGRSKLVFLYLKYFEKKKNYEIHFITNGGDSLDRLNEIPLIKFKKLSFATGIENIFYYNKFYRQLKKYVNENNIDLIHTHHRFPELVSVKIAKELNIKSITSAHSFVNGFSKLSFKSDKIISVSKSITLQSMNKYGVNKDKIDTLYNPINEFHENNYREKEIIKRETGINPKHKVLLFIGRINLDKGIDKLIQAYEIVHSKNKDVLLIICGRNESRQFSKLRFTLSVPIIIIPSLNEIKKLFHITDLVILPSRIDPFPFVMIEAGSYKKPFIGGKTGGIAEFIENGIDGILINPEDADELAEKILFLLKNDSFAKKLGENLFMKVKDKCDYQKYFSQVEEIYNSLLETK